VARTLPLLESKTAAVCCAGALDSPLERGPAEDLAGLLKAVADPVRLQLLSIIRAAEGQEACVCDLTPAVGLSQPTVSHHLKVLTDAGLLRRERRASWAWYSLVPARLADVASIFT
jgi:ArsR family transcriptional regulator, arsenate/arsenite/antimonite-responsive transcriptional repressor